MYKVNSIRLAISVSLVSMVAALAMADGKALFEAKCAMCHGKDGKGNPAMVKALKVTPESMDLTSKTAQESTAGKLIEAITKGQGKMKAVAGVTADQAAQIGDYVKTLGKAPETKKTDAAPAVPAAQIAAADLGKAAETYKAKCQMCHAANGKGNAPLATSMKLDLAALDLTSKATLDKSNEELDKITLDGSGKMPAYKGKLSEAKVKDLTAYIRQLAAK